MIDLDDFKSVNDTYGHLEGDKYLQVFARCLREVFQRYGFCYRMGGDEFCVLLEKSFSGPSAEVLAGALYKKCGRLHGLPSMLSFSYGYQPLGAEMTMEEAVDLADKTMYREKISRKEGRAV